ncbi:AtpZ/AtpI family protein [Hyphococcus sp.]|uniref:AtpZ/AtpI family protein n=1 Tax=Hyphococcus sp. TaxID=2038636 RepID=UPI003753314C
MVRAISRGADSRLRLFSGMLMSNDSGGDKADNDRPPSLDEFSERLDRVRGSGDAPSAKGSASAWGRAMRISSDLLAGLFVGCLLGLGLDHWLETKPLFLLVGMAFGFAAGLRNMMRTLNSDNGESSND